VPPRELLFQTLRQPPDQRLLLVFIKVVSYSLCVQCRRDLPFYDMKPLIGDEKYQTILNSETPQDKMRKLLNFLTTTKLKDKLYQTNQNQAPEISIL
uniref:Uncharacterized protein n=1 Tax=Sinocyclocheilus anshuiensis TaxID=1608454 RepID=A0A671Q9N9_9TELE